MRKFGVEIEFFGMTMEKASEIVNKITPCVIESYNHNKSESWKIVPDSSVHFRGFELVSPVLSTEDDFKRIKEIVNSIKKEGGDVDESCGFHVHVDAGTLTGMDITNILKRYEKHEHEIDMFMTPNRRRTNNDYCRSLKSNPIIKRILTKKQLFCTPKSITDQLDSRRYKLNTKAFLRHHTVEFRQHHGTLDAEEMIHWIKFCINFVEKSLVKLKSKFTFEDQDRMILKALTERHEGCPYIHCNCSQWNLFKKLSRYISNNQAIQEYLLNFQKKIEMPLSVVVDEDQGYFYYKLGNAEEVVSIDKLLAHFYEIEEPVSIFEGLIKEDETYFLNKMKEVMPERLNENQ